MLNAINIIDYSLLKLEVEALFVSFERERKLTGYSITYLITKKRIVT